MVALLAGASSLAVIAAVITMDAISITALALCAAVMVAVMIDTRDGDV